MEAHARNEFADLIRRQRKALRHRLSDVADASGISVPYLSELERGRKEPPSPEVLARLANFLELAPHQLAAAAERSRRSISLPLEHASSAQRHLAQALLRRLESGELTDELARELIQRIEHGQEEHHE